MTETLREKAKRHPRIVNRLLAGGLVLALLTSATLTYLLNSEQQKSADIATQAALSQAEVEAGRMAAQSRELVAQAKIALDNGDPTLALQLALEANRDEHAAPEAQAMLTTLLYAPGVVRFMPDQNSRIADGSDGVITPDGRYLLEQNEAEIVRIDIATGQAVGHYSGTILSASITPDSSSWLEYNTCQIRDVVSGAIKAHLVDEQAYCAARFNPSTQQALVLIHVRDARNFNYTLYDMTTWQPIKKMPFEDNLPFTMIAWGYSGVITIEGTGSQQRMMSWNLTDDGSYELPEPLATVARMGQGEITSIINSRSYLYALTKNGLIIPTELPDRTAERFFQIPEFYFGYLAGISPDGSILAVSVNRDSVVLLDTRTGYKLMNLKTGTVDYQVVFSADSQTATMMSNTGLFVIDLVGLRRAQRLLRTDNTYDFMAVDTQYLAPNDTLFANSGTGLIRLNTLTGETVWTQQWEHPEFSGRNIGYSPATDRIAYLEDEQVKFRDAATGSVIAASAPLPDFFKALPITSQLVKLNFNADGTHLAISLREKMVVYDMKTLQPLYEIGLTASPVNYPIELQVLDDTGTKLVIIGKTGGEIRPLENLSAPGVAFTLPASSAQVTAVKFMPDGKQLLLMHHDGTLTRIDAETGTVIAQKRLLPPGEIAFCSYIQPETDTIMLCSSMPQLFSPVYTNMITLSTGSTWQRWQSDLRGVSLSPEGTYILDGDFRRWDIRSREQLLGFAWTQRYVPEFTCEQRDQYHLTPCSPEIPATQTPQPTWTPAP